MNTPTPTPSHLFTLRLWSEQDTDGRPIWRGRLHCVTTNDTRHFRDWSPLIPLLLAMLRDAETNATSADLPNQ